MQSIQLADFDVGRLRGLGSSAIAFPLRSAIVIPLVT
jgi:hypothetical protein